MSTKDSAPTGGSSLAVPTSIVAAKLTPKRDRRDVIAMIVVVIAIGLVMEVASGFVPDYILPSPQVIARSLFELLTSDPMQVFITLGRLAVAIVFSMVAGVTVGLLMGTSRRIGPYLRALVIIDTGIPALS